MTSAFSSASGPPLLPARSPIGGDDGGDDTDEGRREPAHVVDAARRERSSPTALERNSTAMMPMPPVR